MHKIAVGIMSGTSLDGIDVAVVKINGFGEKTNIRFIAGKTYNYDEITKKMLLEVINPLTSNVINISNLNYKLGELYSSCVEKLFIESNLDLNSIDFVACHGQTIWHDPIRTKFNTPNTFQIGEGSVITQRLKCTVITNFRAADIAAGGQGAPLVSFVDKLLFKKYNKIMSLHNLGGISNLTIINGDNTISYDTGPANIMINYAMKKLFDLEYDESGLVASMGYRIDEMYQSIMSIDYFSNSYPKSTGRELFSEALVDKLIFKYIKTYNKEDIIRTLTDITIDSICNEYLKLIKDGINIEEIVFSGGGIHNKYILDSIKVKLPMIRIVNLEEYNISSDFKEAIAFAVLGNQTINKQPSNLMQATGAKKEVILGQISNYYEERK